MRCWRPFAATGTGALGRPRNSRIKRAVYPGVEKVCENLKRGAVIDMESFDSVGASVPCETIVSAGARLRPVILNELVVARIIMAFSTELDTWWILIP